MNNFTTMNMTPEHHYDKWSWFILIGVVLAILGVLALAYQFIATVFSVYYIAALLAFAGISQIVQAFKTKGPGNTVLWAILGVLYLVTGIIALYNPVAVSSAITLIIAFLFVIGGIIQTIGAIYNRTLPRWTWLLFSGIITLLLGLLILGGWPGNSLWILGMFLGIDLILQGWAYINIGFALRSRYTQ